MAFIRMSEPCGDAAVPTQWAMEVLAVYMSNMGAGGRAPSKEEIEAKVGYLDALKFKLASRNGAKCTPPKWAERT
jgi:hypothetical protein